MGTCGGCIGGRTGRIGRMGRNCCGWAVAGLGGGRTGGRTGELAIAAWGGGGPLAGWERKGPLSPKSESAVGSWSCGGWSNKDAGTWSWFGSWMERRA
jgi:hypothetical protein